MERRGGAPLIFEDDCGSGLLLIVELFYRFVVVRVATVRFWL